MVRKIINLICIITLATLCITERASAYTIYEGNISSTQLTYFKDIANNLNVNDDYVFFRSGQYDYTMIVGDLEYADGVFSMVSETGKEYTISQSDYNSSYGYEINEIDTFTVNYNNSLVYSNLGDFPQLIERGTQYETLIIGLLLVIILSGLIYSIFKHR